jgi:hypothetical protein
MANVVRIALGAGKDATLAMNILRQYFTSDHYNYQLKQKFPHLADQILDSLSLSTSNPAIALTT